MTLPPKAAMCSPTGTDDKGANVLTRIVNTKAAHIASLKLRFPEQSLTPKCSDRSLFDALKAPNAGFILECKKASPSKGLIREDFDVEAIADIYGRYAAAISVLTDEQFFQGDMDYIPRVRARVSQPILCKDFFVDPYQVRLAAHQGADAILLMLSVLDDEKYRLLAAEAAKYRLDTLTEVSNQTELARAIALDAPIIGINNRNLRDLSTNLATTEALAPQIPANRVVISESGIHTAAQVRRLSPLVNGFLVGSSIMAEEDIDLACRKLIFGHNKVCGLTRTQDAQAVAEFGAVYGGLIFAPHSKRRLTLAAAKALVEEQRKLGPTLLFVGVFVDQPIEELVDTAATLGLYGLQLHGSETEKYMTELRAALKAKSLNTQVWKAMAVPEAGADAQAELPPLPEGVDRYLYDSAANGQFGGTGINFDWQRVLPNRNEAMLAGGLNPDNAFEANRQGFYGLDFNSGLESQPGIKDEHKIAAAFAKLRRY
jgi:indole-3-glycerol phosphate synthase / phosphoribosylanthranilate isomerase